MEYNCVFWISLLLIQNNLFIIDFKETKYSFILLIIVYLVIFIQNIMLCYISIKIWNDYLFYLPNTNWIKFVCIFYDEL